MPAFRYSVDFDPQNCLSDGIPSITGKVPNDTVRITVVVDIRTGGCQLLMNLKDCMTKVRAIVLNEDPLRFT